MTKETFISYYKDLRIVCQKISTELNSQYTGGLADRTIILNGTKKTIKEVEDVRDSLADAIVKIENIYKRVYKSDLWKIGGDAYPTQADIEERCSIVEKSYNEQPKMK